MNEGRTWKGKVIFHVDMNSFYASVEKVYNPSLKHQPVAIAGNPKERRGIVVTASYEARARGVKTTMPVWEAREKCPDLIILPPDFEKYRAMSRQIFELLRSYSPLVEPVSIDEGYVDMTSYFPAQEIGQVAKGMQQKLLEQLGLPASIGIAPNKFLAKMASDMKKPLGITILRKRELPEKLWPLPVEEMHGVGKKSAQQLRRLGIYTIGDLATHSSTFLELRFGKKGRLWSERANGMDYRKVDPESVHEVKSVGNSTTLPYDVEDKEELKKVLKQLSEKVAKRLKEKEVCTDNIQLTIRYNDRRTITRSETLPDALMDARDIYNQAVSLFEQYWNEKGVRLLGVTALDVIPLSDASKQLDLFSYERENKEMKINKTISKLVDKYGDDIIRRGTIDER